MRNSCDRRMVLLFSEKLGLYCVLREEIVTSVP